MSLCRSHSSILALVSATLLLSCQVELFPWTERQAQYGGKVHTFRRAGQLSDVERDMLVALKARMLV
jgi:hypothetical protein